MLMGPLIVYPIVYLTMQTGYKRPAAVWAARTALALNFVLAAALLANAWANPAENASACPCDVGQ